MKEISVAEEWLPYVKADLMVRTHPQVKTVGVIQYRPSEYGPDYYRVKGDGALIYQGFVPGKEAYSQFEIDLGTVPVPLTSKWFRGDISYTDNGNFVELRNTRLLSVTTYYDTNPSAAGMNRWDWKVFICRAIDSFSGSSISGQGYFEEHKWEFNTQSEEWEEKVTVERNKTLSGIPVLEDITRFTVKFGTRYVNGEFVSGIGSTGFSFLTDGDLNMASNPPPFDTGGTVPISSVSSSMIHEQTTIEGEEYGLFRLWYSNKRQFQFDMRAYDLNNIPTSPSYEGNTLPYNAITVEVNPEGFPDPDNLEDEEYHRGSRSEAWGRIEPINGTQDQFRYYTTGTILLCAPANKDIEKEEPFVDETWTQEEISTGTFSYTKDEENRPPKFLPFYIADDHVVEFRLKLTLANPKYYRDIRGFKK